MDLLSPERRTLLVLAVVAALGWSCACAKRPMSMRDEAMFHAPFLSIGLFNAGAEFDRSKLLRCSESYPALAVATETLVHRALRDAGMTSDMLLAGGDDFANYSRLSGFGLLLVSFRTQGVDYLRMVNYLSRRVTTVTLDVWAPSCEQVLLSARLVALSSHPPLADIAINGRLLGEAPRWVWLEDGEYEMTCTLPSEVFRPLRLRVPSDLHGLCRREAESGVPVTGPERASLEEKMGAVLLTLVMIAGAAAAVLLPILFLF